MNVISLGAGVQSSTMALMVARGELGPMPSAAIFADTQAEPTAVYEWLAWLEKQLPFPVRRVTQGNLAKDSVKMRVNEVTGLPYYKTLIPAFVATGAGRGMLMRKCTTDYKVIPLVREAKRLMKESEAARVVQWIGISLDESRRMKPSREKAIEHRWPLIEEKMSRWDCIRWMKRNGYPEPPKSACVFCPYHSDGYWRKLRDESPADFERAVSYEREFQKACSSGGAREPAFLHASLMPLDQVDFSTDVERGQQELFGVECEGLCGV